MQNISKKLVVRIALVALVIAAVGANGAFAAVATCYTPVVERCCKVAGATMTKSCSADGQEWTCVSPTPSSNPLIQTTKKVETGWLKSVETGATGTCSYRQVDCGTTPGTCVVASQDTDVECKEKVVQGPYCESPDYVVADAGSSGDPDVVAAAAAKRCANY